MIQQRTRPCLTGAAIAAALVVVGLALHTARDEAMALTSFFEEVDHNRDGQVDEDEAKRYIGERIGGQEYDTAGELSEAYRHMVKNIDKDQENLISVNEVQQHLHTLQQAVSVKEWVQHGLGFPQYAERFRENRITAEDFPLLVNDDGKIFEEELQITSRLHRNQIIRGMKRLILGLGELPSAPQVISCRTLSEEQSALQWASPVKLGDPHLHKYVIESRDVSTDGALWTLAAEVEAHVAQTQYTYVLDHLNKQPEFRVVAWTPYGPSQYANFTPHPSHQTRSISHTAAKSQDVVQTTTSSFTETASKASTEETSKSERTAVCSLLVIAVMIGLRVLTSQRIAVIKCCLLYHLEQMATGLRMKSLAKKIHKVKRQECSRCKARCPNHHHDTSAVQEKAQPPLLSQTHAFSHKIEPVQHFNVDKSRISLSQSSHALGDPKVDYKLTAWNAKEAKQAVEQLPLSDYPLNAWDSSERPTSTSSNASDVRSQLIEGQCAHEGCLVEWKGVFQFRNRWSRHFCSICLRTYCSDHTRISPHGAFGFCGQYSRCVCETCFAKLPAATQSRLEAINKLEKSKEKKDELERSTWMRESSRKDSRSSSRSMTGHDKPQPTRRASRAHADHGST